MDDKLLRQVIGGVVLLLVLVIVIRWFNGRGEPAATDTGAVPAAGSESRVYEIEPPAQAEPESAPQARSPGGNEVALAAPADAAGSSAAPPDSAAVAAAPESATPANMPPQPADSNGKYVVQVGSYTNQSYADALVKELTTAGYPVLVEEAAMEGRKIYRVRIGPYSESTARAMSAQLNDKLKQPAAVMRR